MTVRLPDPACLMTLALCLGALLPLRADPQLVIDLGRPDGPATWRATGFLWSITADEPSDELLMSLKPQRFRCCLSVWDEHGVGMPSVVRMARNGVTTQVQISDEYAYRFKGYQFIDHWPGQDGDFRLWEEVIEDCVKRVAAEGIEVQWDVWEEPNYNNWWRGSRQLFFDTWAFTHRKLRELDPDCVIVGPSLSEYNETYLKDFLRFARDQEVLPDVLSWHELTDDSPRVLLEHAEDIRAFMKQEGIGITDIDINEYVSPGQVAIPGVHVWYFAFMERAKITGACKACWWDETLWNTSRWPTLDGLLTYPDLKPRSTWWVYKAYADMTGTLMEVTGTERLEGLAGVDEEDKAVRLLLGRNATEGDTPQVRITNLNRTPWLVRDGAVRVTAHRIPHTGWKELPEPLLLRQETYDVEDDSLTLTFADLQPNEALMVELRRP